MTSIRIDIDAGNTTLNLYLEEDDIETLGGGFRSGQVERMLRDAVRRVHAAYGITPPARLEPGEGEG